MRNNWIVREGGPDDAKAIAELQREVGGAAPGWGLSDFDSWWKWWNLDNPARKSYTFLADDAGTVVGHNSRRGTWLNFGGARIFAVLSWGAMTHPAYRGKGIGRSSAVESDVRAALDGAVLAFAPVSELGRLPSMSIGRHDLGGSRNFVKVLNPWAVVQKKTGSAAVAAVSAKPLDLMLRLWTKGRRGHKQPGQVNIVEVSFFDSRFDCLWSKLKDVFRISLWKDAEYLNWRYISCPHVKYEILGAEEGEAVIGFIVLRCIDNRYRAGHIVDFAFLPQKLASVSLLIDAALHRLRDTGAEIAVCDMWGHSPYHKLFTSHGFFPWGEGRRWVLFQLLPDIRRMEFLDGQNWYLTLGDTDII